jgi:predicted NAD/FAD-dependent oxidoreductase/GNAT superfamily N-acetyltransferase
MGVHIERLTGHDHLAPLLADWHHREWGHLYAPGVWERDAAEREFVVMAQPGSSDQTWVAFDDTDGDLVPGSADAVLGSVSLVASDDLTGYDHLTPWLASLFVTDPARGRAVGTALVDAVLAAARDAGHEVVYLFTAGQQEFWAARGWSVVDRIETEGHPASVMARSTHPHATRRVVCSHWCSDPDTGGAYTYLRVGGTPEHRRRLQHEILPLLWFAGEATSSDHPATMHGAWFSGERAADQVLATEGVESVLVIGAGLAGLVAAQRLQAGGREVVVVESKPHAGGRIATTHALGAPLPLGGAWLHGEVGHPMADLVDWTHEDWQVTGGIAVARSGTLDAAQLAQVEAAYDRAHEHYAMSAADVSVRQAASEALDTMTELSPVVRSAVLAVLTAECESLYAAPMDDIAANGGFESYELPGDDRLILGGWDSVIERLSSGLDLRVSHRITALSRSASTWRTDTGVTADAVVVTVPAPAMHRVAFEPALPDDVVDSLAHLGAGPVVKVFARFDAAWWPTARPLRLVGSTGFLLMVDVSAVAGAPTLCAFATGDAARVIEHLGEHDLCRLIDRALTETGLRDTRF